MTASALPKAESRPPAGSRLLRSAGRWPLIILGFLLRLAPLGRYVTPDEPAWVYRAILFADALASGDWAAIPSTGHPGATTMWLGALGVAVQRLLNPTGSIAHLEWIRHLAWLAPENGAAFHHLVFFLPWGRVAVALATTLGLVILYPLLARLFGRRLAMLNVGLLVFDPFLIGHSSLLHTDALLATFSLLALVAALNGVREPRRVIWWALSGLFTGLTLLTKTPALILFPFALCPLAVAALLDRPSPPATRLLRALAGCSVFTLVVLAAYFALYPALWANPSDALRTVFAFAGQQVEMAQRPIFFAGRTTYDPGPFFYPAVFLFRVSPVVLVGLAIGLIALNRLPSDRRAPFLLPIAFAIGFGALMSLGAKKHDRYLLPAIAPLPLAAALGWGHLKRLPRSRTLLCALLLIQLVPALVFAPYPLTASNLLAGGPWIADRVLSLDWGEGMGAAARWLNRKPDAEQLTVATASVPTFASLFRGRTVPLEHATLADYIVGFHTDLLPYPPTHTIHVGFIDRAAVYANTAPIEQAAYLAARVAPEDAIILDADTPLLRHYAGPGTLVALTALPTRAATAARLSELSAGRTRLWLVADPSASPITAAHLRTRLESIATPVSTVALTSATVTQYANVRPQPSEFESHVAKFGDHLTLVDALLPVEPVNTPFRAVLRWQSSAPTSTDMHASLYLQDADGHLWAETGQLVINDVTFPTSAWTSAEWADNTVTLRLPERVPPGTYTIRLTVTDAEGAQLGAWDAGGKFQGVRISLGKVEIAPPAEPVGPAPCAAGRAVAAGPFLVCIPELASQAVPSGDAYTVGLTWSATAPPRADYALRWRLQDTTGSVAMEQFIDLSPYGTSHWREGDSFEARHDMRIVPSLPAATYTLGFNVLTPERSPLWDKDEPFAAIEVLARERLFDLPGDIAHPLHLTLGDIVHLRGFDLSLTEAVPGSSVPLTLYWQGDGPTDVDYTFFVHLAGPDGQLYGQVDRFPGGGAAPTTSWAPGQVVIDEPVLPVAADAPAGIYHVAVGLYDGASGGRLPITDASGQSLADDQFILPIEIRVTGGSE